MNIAAPIAIVAACAGFGLGLLWMVVPGSYEASPEKAYFCGYARGMRWAAARGGIDIGPIPIQGCERFDKLDTLK